MITQKHVRNIFRYNPETGALSRRFKNYTQLNVGSFNECGYLLAGVGQSRYRVHRLIFLYHHGYLPKYLDHINGIKYDNRIENLRECTISQNGCNIKSRDNCSSKTKGVSWSKQRRLWEAYININKSRIVLGRFWDEETAAQVVSIARLKHHGEFANNG